jgi:outer membrane receptor protein involved in Fe transport
MASIRPNNNIMKKIITLLLISCFGVVSFAQYPGAGQRGGGAGRAGGQGMNMGHFYGKIVDKKSSKGVSAASVQLIQSKRDSTGKAKDVIVSGMLTKSNGDFSLENLPIMGNYRLSITAIGFKPIDQKVSFNLKMPQGAAGGGINGGGGMEQALAAVDKDLGNIKLEEDAQVLENVTVTSSKPLFTMGVDRKVFNVEKNIVSSGQTAQELMKSIPSINVDIDGNVTLRNAAPTIFVDGRPTTLTLDQIPADAIESVEIITNPSAKYDASGGNAGILNIVLKKNRKAGYNGNIRAGVDSRGRFNGGGDLNAKQGKVNFFASANFNQRKSINTSSIFRHNLTKPLVDVDQNSKGTNIGSFAFGRAGLDYLIDNRNTLSFSGVIVDGNFNNIDNLNFDSTSTGTLFTRGNQLTQTKFHFRNYGASMNFKHNFAKAGKDITADLNYNSSLSTNDGSYTTNLFQPDGTSKGITQLRQTDGNGANKFFTAQVDYTDPISDHAKIETGARVAVRDNTSISNNYFLNAATGAYDYNALLSNNYQFTDRVYAGYFTFSDKIKTWSYQLGVRAESSDYTGTLLQAAKTTFNTKYPISLFPSVFITKELKNNQDFQINFSRRVNRPNFFQLIPYTDISDPQNFTKGNPALKPEFTNSFEMSYQKTFPKNNSLLVTAYYKRSTNLITRYTYRDKITDISPDSAYFTTYLNANNSESYGLELTTRNPIATWWEMITNFNFYNSKINGSNIDKSLQTQRLSYFIKWNNNFKLPANFTIQLSGDYQSKSVLPQSSGQGGRGGGYGGGGGAQPTAQGYVNANYGFDAAIKKVFLKNNAASLTLSVNDIFKTKKYSYYSESSYFTQTSIRRRDPQVFRLNFAYRFGKVDVSLFKRKNMKGGLDTPDVPMGQ